MTSSTGAGARLQAERDDLQAQVAGLERDLDGVVRASEASNADDEHDPEGATIAFERAQLQAVLRAARGRLEDVQSALARVDEPGWGRCEACGGDVGAERLQARPSARRCVGCA